jgi:hypothetical protein
MDETKWLFADFPNTEWGGEGAESEEELEQDKTK